MLAPGESGAGLTWRYEPSPYRGSDRDRDLTPQFRYDSRFFFLHSDRLGLKLEGDGTRYELFLKRRTEGFASNLVPEGMAGMEKRAGADDLGVAARWRLGAGALYAEAMRNVSEESEGLEVRLGYRYEGGWKERGGINRLRWRPYATAAWRDAKLNDYYYGVRPEEATAARPAYRPGAGLNLELGVLASYRIFDRWQAIGALGVTRWSGGVADSPVVESGTQPFARVGLLYGFKPDPASELDRKPLIMRLAYGNSTDCDLLPILGWSCTSTHTQDNTDILTLDIGQILVKRVNGWPLDLAGFLGFTRHREAGLQPDFWQINVYVKPIYYFGPWWRERLRTRFGFGAGISYASRIPFAEQRDQAIRGRDTSKLLLYLDPTIDINVGDLFKAKELGETYVGIGVSHRSGVFGSAKLFNSVDGGSNYIYFFVESGF